MSPTIDPEKLKVIELREELQARGLDTKGTKPVLIKRLKKALKDEQSTEQADDAGENTDTNVVEVKKEDVPERKESVDSVEAQEEQAQGEQNSEEALAEENAADEDNAADEENKETNGGDSSAQEPLIKPKEEVLETPETVENADVEMKTVPVKTEVVPERKGEKRKRSVESPERVVKKREKSPVKEDEPEVDLKKVLLSWYDSDLHLLIDKETLLSAKPIHEGLFGYAWAGVRATHGVKSGKVRYEVKITEELKWEDFTNQRKERQEKAKERKEKEKQRQQAKKKTNAKSKDEAEAKQEDKKETKENAEESVEKTEEAVQKEEGEGEKMEVTEEDKETTEEGKTEEVSENKEEETENKEEVEEEENKEAQPEEPILTHILRVGWSVPKSSLQLGEDEFSYCYESTGKFVSNKEFVDFAAPFKMGDVVGAYLNITEEAVEMQFTVNGELQPETHSISRSDLPENFVLFPHILSRNLCFELNMGQKEEPWFPNPQELEHVFIQDFGEKLPGITSPAKRDECEVIMMFGLPGSGKTHWVKEYLKKNEDKEVTVIGSTYLLDRMTVRGQPLKSTYNGRWSILLDKLQRCLNRLSDIAVQRRRNYILDQTNVFPSAQRRKMRAFEGFKRRAVVVVVADEEQAKRQSLKEAQDGIQTIPDFSIMEMKANMALPTVGEFLEEVEYADLKEEEAKAQVAKLNAEAKSKGYQPGVKKTGFKDDRNRWSYRRSEYIRGSNFRDARSFQRFDRGPRGWGPPPPRFPRDRRPILPPMAAGRDWMRNNRGPPRPPMGVDRNGRDARPAPNFNRSRPQGGGGGAAGRPSVWQAGGGNFNQGSWGQQQQQGNWGSGGQSWGGYQQGGWNANQWKYGGGGGGGNNQQGGGYGHQQGYGQNWNNYYAQNWTGQGQQGSAGMNAQYQQWAQYAHQYAQQGQNARYAGAAQK